MVPLANCLFRDLAFIVISLAIVVVFTYTMLRRVKILMRQSDEVVAWHGIEVKNQDAHRERLERRFDMVEVILRRNSESMDRIIDDMTKHPDDSGRD